MRATQVALLGLVLWIPTVPLLARAENSCPWKDPGKPPRIYVEDRVVFFRVYYTPEWATCVIAKGNKRVEVEWLVGNNATPVQTDKVDLYAGKDNEPRKLGASLFPNHTCDEKRPHSPHAEVVTAGLPGKEQVAELVQVRVRVKAVGELSPLTYTSPAVEVPCAACDLNHQGSAMIRTGDNNKDLIFTAEAERSWFECASHGATLVLRGFAGDSHSEVLNAIRPDLSLAGLEKEFVLRGDKYILRKPLPMARLCGAKTHTWSFELWGHGELMHLGGGGREVHEVRCK
jgi:hypothetical protein